ncbi:hypothetical protein HOI83_00435 [Candidatus Uhrbacteria bacterium]|jgi:DNA-binding MarR family transcriptional regulator|nr:hypothetical protein [Candidatus Uhrbacteria bacterium]
MDKTVLAIEIATILVLIALAVRKRRLDTPSKRRLESEKKVEECTYLVAKHLFKRDEVLLSELRRELDVDNKTLEQVLHTLKRSGHVSYRSSLLLVGHMSGPDRGRRDYFWLTPKGRAWAGDLTKKTA